MKRILSILLIVSLLLPGVVFGKMKKTENSKSKRQLKRIHLRNLERPVQGDLMQATLEAVEDLMKPKGVRFRKEKVEDTGFRPKFKEIKEDKLGHKHIRMLQYYKGLPVVGGELIIHINEKGVIHLLNGNYLSPIDVSIEPTIDGDTALQVAYTELQDKSDLRLTKGPSLVIYDSHLAYHFVISYAEPLIQQWWYYVDAHTGEVILRYNNVPKCVPTSDGTPAQVTGNRLVEEGGGIVTVTGWHDNDGNYYLYNPANNWGIFDESTNCWALNTFSDWGDSYRVEMAAAYNLSLIQQWVTDVLGRCSFDEVNCPLSQASIHVEWNIPTMLCDTCAAMWDPENNTILIGDGDGSSYAPFSTLDIMAHEYGHGITQYTSGLQYYGESGALNESYSDIMGTAVEFACQPDGTSAYPDSIPGSIPGHADWLCGEDTTLYKEAMRDLKNPGTFEHPSYYWGTNWFSGDVHNDDQGGVHLNSGVQNFAFYLLAEGGSGSNDGHSYNITGIGVEDAAKVAMRANIEYLTSRSLFSDSRDAWIAAADDLSLPTATVEAVWDAVGVFETECGYYEELLAFQFSAPYLD